MHLGRHPPGSDLEFVAARQDEAVVDPRLVTNVTEPDVRMQRVPVAGRRQPADPLAVTVDGFAAEQDRVGIFVGKDGQALSKTLLALRQQRVPADEIAVRIEGDRESETGLIGRIVGAYVAAPKPIGLLQAQ